MDSTVHRILQARILHISQPRDQTQVSHIATEPQGKWYNIYVCLFTQQMFEGLLYASYKFE